MKIIHLVKWRLMLSRLKTRWLMDWDTSAPETAMTIHEQYWPLPWDQLADRSEHDDPYLEPFERFIEGKIDGDASISEFDWKDRF